MDYRFDTEYLRRHIADFCRAHHIEDEGVAVNMILMRYFRLSYSQREQVEKKIDWELHRNRGFRSLPQFVFSVTAKKPKPKAKTKPKTKAAKKPEGA
jgi:hypothetical protein